VCPHNENKKKKETCEGNVRILIIPYRIVGNGVSIKYNRTFLENDAFCFFYFASQVALPILIYYNYLITRNNYSRGFLDTYSSK
jgi:hypothetical protein